MKHLLTQTDNTAVDLNDANYINNKGAKLYEPETYDKSVEYYHLAAAMGNIQAISNLGYCYLYGRSIEPDLSLALAYFKIAAKRGNVDAAYKLGDIYGREKWGVMDKELSVYYYRMAASFVMECEWSDQAILYNVDLQSYPSLCYALGREMSLNGAMNTELDKAYLFLKHAEMGYHRELMNGNVMYKKSYYEVKLLLTHEQFDPIRIMCDEMFREMMEE